MSGAKRITAREVKSLMDKGQPVFFIDTRQADAWAHSPLKLPGAVHILPDKLKRRLDRLPRDRTIVTYCT